LNVTKEGCTLRLVNQVADYWGFRCRENKCSPEILRE